VEAVEAMLLEDLYRLMRVGHVQAQGVVDTMTQPVVVLDQHLCVTTANNAFIKAFQVARDDILSQSFFSLGDGQWDILELRQLLSSVIPRAAAIIGFQVKHDFPGIGPRTFLVDARRLVHPDDNSPDILVMFDDVTDRQRHDAEMDFVVAEMRHRLKNLSAVVQAVVKNSAANEPAVARFKESLLGRLQTTFKAQEITDTGDKTELQEILESALGEALSARLECSGSTIHVSPTRVVPISLIFHELGTNAVKHGAASVPEGRILLRWEVEEDVNGRRVLMCRWSEADGPTIMVPERDGYGSELIQGLASHLGGAADITFTATGLVCTLRLQIRRLRNGKVRKLRVSARRCRQIMSSARRQWREKCVRRS